MRVDQSLSLYRESPDAREEFDPDELEHCRVVARRMFFLEHKIREGGGIAAEDANGGAAWVSLEFKGLVWLLTELGFLETKERESAR